MHSVANSISNHPENIELLPYIACNILNVLAADVVTIYEYDSPKKEFKSNPYIAGKLKRRDKMDNKVDDTTVPLKLFSDNEIFKDDPFLPVESKEEYHIFKESKFAKREKIDSVGCVKLEINSIPVGLMFINYRRPHIFSDEEKDLIKTLASSSALAIKNKLDLNSWLSVIDIERQIITTLDRDKLLGLIIKKAVKITNADVGEIRLIEKRGTLAVATNYPNNLSYDKQYEDISIEQGITGLVVKEKMSKIINNIDKNENYIRYCLEFKINSELCVPIIYVDNTIIGILNVESTKVNNFSEKHRLLLEAIANQAAIALHNTATNKKLIAREEMATLGRLSSSLIHKLENNLSLIKTLCQRFAQGLINEEDTIMKLADSIIEEIQGWKELINKKTIQSVYVVWEINQAIIEIGSESFKNIKLIINPSLSDSSISDLQVDGDKLQIREILSNVIKNAQESIEQKKYTIWNNNDQL